MMSVSVFVCLRSNLRNYTSDLHQFFVHVTRGCGSVLLWQSDKLRYSGFMDDVIFAHKLRLLNVAARLRHEQFLNDTSAHYRLFSAIKLEVIKTSKS